MSDPFRDEPSVVAWAHHVISDMVPMMEGSAFVISLSPYLKHSNGIGDVKYWVELGASIMMDKPIITVALAGAELPKKLLAISDEVVYLPKGVSPEGSADLVAAITRMTERLSKEDGHEAGNP